MTRTPIIRELKRQLQLHRDAEAINTSPAELNDRRNNEHSRREFLKRAGQLGAAAAVVGPLSSFGFGSVASASKRPARIAIVGGGIAGLCAANSLVLGGQRPTLYEANPNRIGGRMHSDSPQVSPADSYWSNGQVSEWCGELIDSNHKKILHLAKHFGLAVDDVLGAQPANSGDTYFVKGGYYSLSDATKDFNALNVALQNDANAAPFPTLYNSFTPAGQALDHMSIYDWIESRVPGGHSSRMGALLDSAYNTEYGADTADQSSLNLIYLLAFQPGPRPPQYFSIYGTSDEHYHIRGGNQLLPQAIAESLPDGTIQMGWTMESISLNSDGSIALSFDTGPGPNTTVTADQVILCLPFAVLRTLDYSRAGFDALKKTAITQLGAGQNAKLQLQFDQRYWNGPGPWGPAGDGTIYTDLPFQGGWDVTRAQPGATGILVDYAGGSLAASYAPSSAYSNASDDPLVANYAQQYLHGLEAVYPGATAHWNGKATLSTPFLDPDLLLAYSYWKIGQYTSFSGYERVPQGPAGQIHFAGEHCSINFQGFMEGGAEEGIRAAKEVLALV